MGILTGKFSAETKFESTDWRNRWIDNPEEKEIFLDDLAKVDRLRELTSQKRSLTQLAIQFVLQHEAVTTVIPGAKTKSQFVETVSVATMGDFSEEDQDFLNQITPVGGGRKIWPA
jgi:aryl-alcohol dehydrogenase-like predicted oxidoreductase